MIYYTTPITPHVQAATHSPFRAMSHPLTTRATTSGAGICLGVSGDLDVEPSGGAIAKENSNGCSQN
jgi:hypothetical protein